jgi:hypothetical protein
VTADEKEQAFLRHVENTENYFAAVRANGNVPWFEDLEQLAKLEPSYPVISERTAPGVSVWSCVQLWTSVLGFREVHPGKQLGQQPALYPCLSDERGNDRLPHARIRWPDLPVFTATGNRRSQRAADRPQRKR